MQNLIQNIKLNYPDVSNISKQIIEHIISQQPNFQAYDIISSALTGDKKNLEKMIKKLFNIDIIMHIFFSLKKDILHIIQLKESINRLTVEPKLIYFQKQRYQACLNRNKDIENYLEPLQELELACKGLNNKCPESLIKKLLINICSGNDHIYKSILDNN